MRLFKLSIELLVASLGIFFLTAQVVPRLLIQNNIENLAAEDSQAADYAKQVHRLIEHTKCSQLSALTCTGVKIVELEPMKNISNTNNEPPQSCPYPYQGNAIIYGLFGVASYTIEFSCDFVEV